MKVDCDEDPGPILDVLAPGCDLVGGVEFTVRIGTTEARFATGTGLDLGIFVVDVPDGATVVITEDVTTGTPGFVPRENPITVVVDEPIEAAIFVNVPEGGVGPVVPRRSRDPSASSRPLPIPPARPIVRATPRASVTPPATDTGDPTGRSSGDSVTLVLVGLTLGTAGILLLTTPPRRRRR